MRKIALPLLFLALAISASAKTSANVNPNQGCVHNNCMVFLDDGDHLWIQNDPMYPNHFVGIWDNSGAQVAYCLNNISVYQNTALPDGSVELHVECGSITADEHWLGYHTRAGTRYLVLGGTVSY
jgi:hypothetical protein